MPNSYDQMRIGRELMRKCFVEKDEEACRILADILKDRDERS